MLGHDVTKEMLHLTVICLTGNGDLWVAIGVGINGAGPGHLGACTTCTINRYLICAGQTTGNHLIPIRASHFTSFSI